MTQLADHDTNTEVIVACPASVLSRSKRFKKAYQKLFPNDSVPIMYHRNCVYYNTMVPIMQRTEHIANYDIYILTEKDTQVVNSVGLEGFDGVTFYKVPKSIAYCIKSSNNYTHVEVDKDRFVLQELQKQYNIPDVDLDNILKRTCSLRNQIHQMRSLYDTDEEEDIGFTSFD